MAASEQLRIPPMASFDVALLLQRVIVLRAVRAKSKCR